MYETCVACLQASQENAVPTQTGVSGARRDQGCSDQSAERRRDDWLPLANKETQDLLSIPGYKPMGKEIVLIVYTVMPINMYVCK